MLSLSGRGGVRLLRGDIHFKALVESRFYKNSTTPTAEVSCDDFAGCQSGGEGSGSNAYSCEATNPYLQNDRADTADSRKSTQETTQNIDST